MNNITILFSPSMSSHKDVIKTLRERKVLSDNCHSQLGGLYDETGNYNTEEFEPLQRTYCFSEWLGSIHQLSDKALYHAMNQFPHIEIERLSPEIHYELTLTSEYVAILKISTEIGIDAQGGDYKSINVEHTESCIASKYYRVFRALEDLRWKPIKY